MTPPDYDIRYSEPGDLASMKEWFSLPHACDNYIFSSDEMEDFLKNWIGFSKFKASLTGTLKEGPCAVGTLFLMPYRKVAHHCSFQLIVAPQHRRKGIGASMVRNLLNLAKTRFRLESVHAELFEPSPLFSILEKLQFRFFARQEHFVKMEDGTYRARLLLEHFF